MEHYELVNLYIVFDSNQRYLFQDGSITSIGIANSLSSSDVQFSFGISVGTNDEDLIISASSDIAITFEVFVEYEIFYKTSFRKRSIQSQQLGLSKQISLDSRVTQQRQHQDFKHEMIKANSSSTFVYSFPLALLVVTLFMFGNYDHLYLFFNL